jgi:hypothetical protein
VTTSPLDHFLVAEQDGDSGGRWPVAAGGEEDDDTPRVLPSGGALIWAGLSLGEDYGWRLKQKFWFGMN